MYAILQKDKLGLFFYLFYCQDHNTPTSEAFTVFTSHLSLMVFANYNRATWLCCHHNQWLKEFINVIQMRSLSNNISEKTDFLDLMNPRNKYQTVNCTIQPNWAVLKETRSILTPADKKTVLKEKSTAASTPWRASHYILQPDWFLIKFNGKTLADFSSN